MASLRHSASVASTVCKQSANSRLTQSVASVQTSSLSSIFTRPTSCNHTALVAVVMACGSPASPRSSTYNSQTRTFLTHLHRQAQAIKEQPISSSTPFPQQTARATPSLQLNNLPYFIRRTGSNQLPVYLVTKAGGTKQLTKIQKTEGDLDALREDLAQALGVDLRSSDVSINRLTGHIIVKGWRKTEILKFLQERNF
ncbi:Phosphopantothenoylcysteine decarboxylase [Penicillium odoratum]|uniref:Phosphopantothenoylcysteine decarboxylase n=1 Tax=Penicillium odoratum TaxID=1167516 RepID=UPI002546EEC6|nr:Phosphopantothenoylcysteine decarboxylase [Penicillium odoratum]KAJ5760733.1 Phosphopantothenoylcysteine decarboxylase [Penicillium odoratum]